MAGRGFSTRQIKVLAGLVLRDRPALCFPNGTLIGGGIMIKFYMFIASLLSVSAFACPDLTGVFKLSIDERTATLEISQSTENALTTFVVKRNGEEQGVVYLADGIKKVTSRPVDEFTAVSEETVSCEDEKLVIRFSEQLVNKDGSVEYGVTGTHTAWINKAQNLMEGLSHTDGEQTHEDEFEWIRQ